jgi:hypothetical protein
VSQADTHLHENWDCQQRRETAPRLDEEHGVFACQFDNHRSLILGTAPWLNFVYADGLPSRQRDSSIIAAIPSPQRAL